MVGSQQPGPGDVAREYLRVSLDRTGQQRSPNEQHGDHEADAERNGWTLGQPYRDLGSASRHARKARDDFERLLADLAAGRFKARVLMLWESSRGSRKTVEWLQLIELCWQHGVWIWVHTHGRAYDPANARDRRSLREDASDSEYESDKVSERTARTAAAATAAGLPHGRVPYGFRRRYDPVTRRLVAQEPDPVEAPVVAELFDRLEAGDSLRGIADDFRHRGIRRRDGKPFTAVDLRPMGLRATYAGKRTHVSKQQRAAGDAVGTVIDGTWPALVPLRQFLAVERLLSSPDRVNTRGGSARHLLSLIAVCGVEHEVDEDGNRADQRLVWAKREVPVYRCRLGHLRLNAVELDGLVIGGMADWLAQSEIYQALDDDTEDAELEAVRARLAAARADHDGLAALSVGLAARMEPPLLRLIAELETRERELMTPAELRGLLPARERLKEWFHSPITPMSAKRQVARLVLAPGRLGRLVVHRIPEEMRGGGRRVPVRDRVKFSHEG